MTTTWRESRFLPVPLNLDEIRLRGEQLAQACHMKIHVLTEHKARREDMKAELADIELEIFKLSRVLNDHVEERAVEVECRLNPALSIVEEVRIDTGELIRTRAAVRGDMVRAQNDLFAPGEP
jgi:hypothetical protein